MDRSIDNIELLKQAASALKHTLRNIQISNFDELCEVGDFLNEIKSDIIIEHKNIFSKNQRFSSWADFSNEQIIDKIRAFPYVKNDENIEFFIKDLFDFGYLNKSDIADELSNVYDRIDEDRNDESRQCYFLLRELYNNYPEYDTYDSYKNN